MELGQVASSLMPVLYIEGQQHPLKSQKWGPSVPAVSLEVESGRVQHN